MSDRRMALMGLAAGAVGLSGAVIAGRVWDGAGPLRSVDGAGDTRGNPGCRKPDWGPTASRFPNLWVFDQHGRKALFYDDLVKGRTVLLHFMSAADEARELVAANVASVAARLGARLGRDCFLCSITVDPERDTPDTLRQLAHRCCDDIARSGNTLPEWPRLADEGWRLVTGARADLDTIRDALFFRPGAVGHDAGRPDHATHEADAQDCSLGLARYGHEPAGLWGAVPVMSDPVWIAARLDWMTPRPRPDGPAKRKAPPPRRFA